jgi:hypothetical protein
VCMRGAVSGSNGLPSLQFALSPVATRNGLTRPPHTGALATSGFFCFFSAHAFCVLALPIRRHGWLTAGTWRFFGSGFFSASLTRGASADSSFLLSFFPR